jgi:hypothetical protein
MQTSERPDSDVLRKRQPPPLSTNALNTISEPSQSRTSTTNHLSLSYNLNLNVQPLWGTQCKIFHAGEAHASLMQWTIPAPAQGQQRMSIQDLVLSRILEHYNVRLHRVQSSGVHDLSSITQQYGTCADVHTDRRSTSGRSAQPSPLREAPPPLLPQEVVGQA